MKHLFRGASNWGPASISLYTASVYGMIITMRIAYLFSIIINIY